ncbi:MAG: hypothetical protein H6658_10600 [Ardenticatenaceae bacterium]|nr:hypothetical protein [Ardenticatenaceae bacterium]
MTRTTKIVIGIVGGLLALCCLGAVALVLIVPTAIERFAENNFTDDPERASEVGQSIVNYDLPAGMQEEGAMGFAGMKMVFFTAGEQDNAVVMLMQFPTTLQMDEDDMQQQMEQYMQQQGNQQQLNNLEVVSVDEVVINDQNTSLTTFEGTDENGNAFRQITGVFVSKEGGPAMLMAMGPITSWEQTDIDEFIDSLK